MINTTLCYSATSGSSVADYDKLRRVDMGNVGENVPTGGTWELLISEFMNRNATPHSVRRLLDILDKTVVVVIDEFDQIVDEGTVRLFASTIKNLSDNLSHSTLILVGVADTVDELIEDHGSIDRALVQILMPRMHESELTEIIRKGYELIGLEADAGILEHMGSLAQGLPHYAHRFGQEAGYSAVDRDSNRVEKQDAEKAIHRAISQTNETIRFAYQRATTSPKKAALFRHVLLACALAEGDELGYFAAGDIRDPLFRVTQKRYDIAQFVGHLKKFCSDRGPVLQSVGEQWKRRYRFNDPLMRPYVVLKGIDSGFISEAAMNFSDRGLHGQQKMPM